MEIKSEYEKGYRQGLIDGIKKYSYSICDIEYVGVNRKTLKEALKEIANDNNKSNS